MTKVKIDIKAGVNPVIVTDEEGRNISLKKPSALANLDFAKAAGTDKMNVLYFAEVFHLKYVASIDNTPVATPSTEAELRALYQRLGDANDMVKEAVAENFLNAETQKAVEDEIKNS